MLKAYLSFLLSLFTFVFLAAQHVHIPDSSFKQCLLDNNEINTNGDDEIQVAEAAAFTGTIYCEDRGIAKLTGIEAFVKITGLECGGNDLIFLNVSKNTELRRLYCGRNEIFSLDLKHNTKLEELSCHMLKIPSIDLSS
ncbi:MAG TPA: hypothetical protein PKW10_13875, partial [Saprospiraceae bacterium]|nr:hypothetical protein [Saprospiraceae bacterium]